jgi:hypothetical protein
MTSGEKSFVVADVWALEINRLLNEAGSDAVAVVVDLVVSLDESLADPFSSS